VHSNKLSGGGDSPDGMDLKALKLAMFGLGGSFPDVLWDGFYNAGRKVDGKVMGPQICLRDVSGVINADGPGSFKNPSKDLKPFDCELPRLPAIDLGRG